MQDVGRLRAAGPRVTSARLAILNDAARASPLPVLLARSQGQGAS
ncbi:MAG TPA: hypothetical protein VE733_23355 [Streptosporangiaceae bacterium]|nr:hypothetical protein [Streptosporangiaceae bacterium]